MEKYEISRLIESLRPNTVEDEMKLKVINRLYHNLTLENLEEIEHYAKQLNRTIKAPYLEDIDV